ncbi:hypothetical protein ABZ927_20790 [Streptomyces massasporeus]
MTPNIDALDRLDVHPTPPSPVIAALTRAQAHVAFMSLEAVG